MQLCGLISPSHSLITAQKKLRDCQTIMRVTLEAILFKFCNSLLIKNVELLKSRIDYDADESAVCQDVYFLIYNF